jgi:putative transposase
LYQMPTPKQIEDLEIEALIIDLDKKFNHTYGYRMLTMEINAIYHKTINHKRIYRIQRELGLQAKIYKKKKRVVHEGFCADNILNRDFKASKPFEKWVTDISIIQTGLTKLYFSAVLDLYSNEIVAYHLSENNDKELVLDTLKKAQKKGDVSGTLIHSDQGHQYTSRDYTSVVKQYQMIKSMSRKANCWDNSPIESFFGHLKEESIRIYHPKTKAEISAVIEDYITFYNHERRQKKLNGLAPIPYKKQHLAA